MRELPSMVRGAVARSALAARNRVAVPALLRLSDAPLGPVRHPALGGGYRGAQEIQRAEHLAGVIAIHQRPAEDRLPVCERRQEQGTVGQAFGAGGADGGVEVEAGRERGHGQNRRQAGERFGERVHH
jgi:hypothetical protein